MADVLKNTNLCDDEDAHDELLVKQKRLVGECKKKQLHVEVKMKKNMADATVLTQLNRLRGEYVELKNSTRYQQSVLLIMQELSSRDKENSPDETAAVIQAKKQTSAESVQSLKNELHDSKTHIEELADTAEKYYAEYQTLLGQMEKCVRLAEEKRGRITQKQQEVQRRLTAIGSNISTKDDTGVCIQLKTDEYNSVQEALQGVQEALAESDTRLPKLKAECRDLQLEMEDVQGFLNDIRAVQKTLNCVRCQLNCVKCQLNCVKCQLNCVRCQLNCVKCQLNCVNCQLNCVRCQLNCVKCQSNCVRCQLNCVRCQLNCVKCQLNCVKCQLKCVRCQLNCVKCQLNCVRCQLNCVRCQLNCVKCPLNCVRCEAVEELLETVSEVRETNITGSSVTLQLSSPLCHHQQQHPPCTLTIHVSLTPSAGYKLQTVQVSPSTLDVKDIIATAVCNNDIRYLVYQVQAVWERDMPLWQEIETLREKFALDWLQTENVLTVLFGNEASIVVRLHINPAYPTSGDVSLLSAVGLPEGTTISQLQSLTREVIDVRGGGRSNSTPAFLASDFAIHI
ncbi:hypothetical protein NP493_1492g00022 [Ridgeia piscesae]|uniref:Uncharacterized protein n=1 Tax=Ridgeia piscesae TaxID=27915 RepID=A0AAD9K2Q2_RIDPI|nr:hypothetical protein NP493_1492g00022 [Ridgeia piscesae]